jgi:hypothetical protein
MTMPCAWRDGGLAGFAGRVRFRRRFGYPGRIDQYERVWLTFAGAGDRALVALNGTDLGRHEGEGGFEFEVTALLRPRNELVVEVEGGEGGGLWGEVALEVRAAAFLRGVSAMRAGNEVFASGEVVGRSEDLLELYLVVDRSPSAYAAVPSLDGAVPFRLSAPITNAEGETPRVAKIELVRGAVTWYTVEVDLLAGGGPHRAGGR